MGYSLISLCLIAFATWHIYRAVHNRAVPSLNFGLSVSAGVMVFYIGYIPMWLALNGQPERGVLGSLLFSVLQVIGWGLFTVVTIELLRRLVRLFSR